MTPSPSDAPPAPAGPLADLAQRVAERVGGTADVTFGTAKVRISASGWKAALTTARDEFDLVFFSWLSATDWANDVAVGDEYDEQVEERYEMMCAVSDIGEGNLIIFSADIGKDSPSIETVSDVYPGANWHEREAAEMFGIDFEGHPDLTKLYLPEGFEGHPLRKSFALLSREVKPWPGKVDVEDMPPGQAAGSGEVSTENPEAPPVEEE